jgi:hypothetical protein
MSIKRLTDLSTIATLADTDLLHIVDVSNVSQNPAGSSFKVTVGQLKAAFKPVIEVPSGAIDASNTAFTVSAAPLYLVADGLVVFEGSDYSRSGLDITMNIAPSLSLRAII